MAAEKPRKSSPFDPQALLEAQRRNLDAFASAGQIVAEGMRTYAERQIAMVQEAMSGLWRELQAAGARGKPAAAAEAEPADRLEGTRGAFEKVMVQFQELGNLLVKTQSDALAVLNECAARNLESLGGAAPELARLQGKAKEAFENASRQTAAVLTEMRKRMASLEEETRRAAAPWASAAGDAARPAPAPPPVPAPPPAPTPPEPAQASPKPAKASGGARRAPAARKKAAPKEG